MSDSQRSMASLNPPSVDLTNDFELLSPCLYWKLDRQLFGFGTPAPVWDDGLHPAEQLADGVVENVPHRHSYSDFLSVHSYRREPLDCIGFCASCKGNMNYISRCQRITNGELFNIHSWPPAPTLGLRHGQLSRMAALPIIRYNTDYLRLTTAFAGRSQDI